MMRPSIIPLFAAALAVIVCLAWSDSASAQTTRPADLAAADLGPTTMPESIAGVGGAAPATQPQAEGKAIQALVVEVAGSVQSRSASRGGPFAPVAKGDTLGGDTLVSVGPRGQAVLSFGDNSVVVLEQFSVMTIDKVYEKNLAGQATVVTRLKLGNGSVRAGVERGRTNSDFQITTPVATLAVRGTRPIRVFFDAGTGQLWFYLAREGRITGTLTGGGRSQDIRPGEGTDQTLTLPVLQAIFDRHVVMGDPWGQTLQEYIVEVNHPSAVGGFGGGSPQTIQQVTREINGGGTPGLSDVPPTGTGGSGGGGFFGDNGFFGDDDSTAASARAKRKSNGK